MLPSTNKVCSWWKQQSLCFKLEALSSRAQCSPLDKINDKNVASIRPQKLLNRIYVSQNDIKPKFKQPDPNIALSGKAQYNWKDKTSYSKKYNQSKKLSNIFLFHKKNFQILFNWHWRLSAHLTETFTSFVFLLRKSGFPIGYAFFCISIKKINRRFFVGYPRE